MGKAKDLHVAPIARADANRLIQREHYSGKFVPNSQVHLGVFLDGRLEGAMQFGPSMDKKKLIGLVRDTSWNGFIELNRMAFGAALPRNSESRALAVAMRLLRKAYPQLEWVISFADGTQCGDGTIYRASGFVLTQIRKNTSLWDIGGEVTTDMSMKTTPGARRRNIVAQQSLTMDNGRDASRHAISRLTVTKGIHIADTGAASMKVFKDAGARPLEGFQLRYVYFLKPEVRERLTCPIIPFSEIEKAGAAMYLGKAKA